MGSRQSNRKFNPGRWQVERERCRIDKYMPAAESRDAPIVGDVIPAVMKRLGLATPHWLAVLTEEWPALVGEDVAAHTRPGRVDGKRLVVFVDNSVWLSELVRYGQRPMLARLQERFGAAKVAAVYLQLDPDGGRASSA